MPQETFQDRSLEKCKMGWQFYRATLAAFKMNTYNNFEGYFYHVNQMLTIRPQDQTRVWLAHLHTHGHHLACCILARGKIQGRMGAWSDPGGQYPHFPSEMRVCHHSWWVRMRMRMPLLHVRVHKVWEEGACRSEKWLDQGNGGQWLCLGQFLNRLHQDTVTTWGQPLKQGCQISPVAPKWYDFYSSMSAMVTELLLALSHSSACQTGCRCIRV